MDAISMMVQNADGVWPWNQAGWFFGALLLLLALADKIEKSSGTKFKPPNSHGAAKFTDKLAVLKKAGLLTREGVPIGYTPDGKHALHYAGFGHLFVCAAASGSLLVSDRGGQG